MYDYLSVHFSLSNFRNYLFCFAIYDLVHDVETMHDLRYWLKASGNLF